MFTKKDIKNIYELTPLQEGMLFHALYDNESLVYFEQSHFHISGELNVPIFEQTWNEIVRRHDILRTIFVHKNVAQPLQIVLKERKVDFYFEDIRTFTPEKQIAHCLQYEQQDRQKLFDLTKDVLMRIAVFQLDEKSFDVIWTLHHILMDGWSTSILYQELMHIYSALLSGTRPNLPPAIPFNQYIKWLKKQDKAAAKQHWQSYLAGYRQLASVPRMLSKESKAFSAKTLRFELSEAVTSALEQLASTNCVTLNTVIQAIWGILLAQYNGREDAVFGATVSGRPADIKGIERMVGLFINAIPIRVNLALCQASIGSLESKASALAAVSKAKALDSALCQASIDWSLESKASALAAVSKAKALDSNRQNSIDSVPAASPTFKDLLRTLQQEATNSNAYHYYSLADIQAETTLKQNLFDHILVFENYPEANEAFNLPFIIDQFEHFDHTNYDLTVQAAPGKSLGFTIIYNQSVYDTTLINHLESHIRFLFDAVLANDELELKNIDVLSAQEKATYLQPSVKHRLTLAVAATFTAEPMAPYLKWWGHQFELAIEVQFAPYNQVFQQLLATDSLLSTNTGANCLLIRFEDWIREVHFESVAEYLTHLDNHYADLVAILADKPRLAPTFVGIFPVSTHLALSEKIRLHIDTLNQQWREFLTTLPNVYGLEFAGLAQLYTVTELFDSHKDKLGHLPFSDEYYAAVGTDIARQLTAWKTTPFKVIALDCDNTLWQGVCGEEGATGVVVTGGYLALQHVLLEKHRQGFLLVLCSKNNEKDVWDVFAQNEQMLLKPEHFATYRINWQLKSTNLVEMAEELNLSPNSFIFIDDSGVECTEVMMKCPEILTLHLPDNPDYFAHYLQHVWAFDKLKVTAEDTQRTAMYQAEQKRQQQQPGLSLDDFLRHLNIKVNISHLQDFQLERVSQLTQRTNQFNLSTIRRTEDEINALTQKEGVTSCWTVEVTDKFGDYGLVGVVIAEQRQKVLFLDTLLLSCRVLGRKVENAILSGLKQYSDTHDLEVVEAEYRATEKNQPILDFLEQTHWQPGEKTETGVVYRISVETLPQSVENVAFSLHSHAEHDAERRGRHSHAEHGNEKVSLSHALVSPSWTVTLANDNNLLHKAHYQPLIHHNGTALLKLPVEELTAHKVKTAYIAPENEQQQQMVAVWQAVLGHEAAIGIDDNFLELGGHSLKATRIVSRIHKVFGVEVSLKDVFQYPTIKTLCEVIDNKRTSDYIKIEPIPAQSHYEVSHAQRRLWVLQQMEENSIAYNTPAFFVIEGNLKRAAFKKAFEEVVKRHESLRTTFITVDGEPRQKISEDIGFQVAETDLSGVENNEELAKQRAEQEAKTPFDLTTGPLLRVTLLKLATERHVLILNLHHITSDGWSIGVLEKEVLTLYAAYSEGKENPLPPLNIQYKDYAAWQNALLAGTKAQQHQAYWHHKLGGELPVLNLPTDYPRPLVQTFSGNTLNFSLDKTRLEELKELGNQHQASLFMSLVALVKILLHHYTAQTDIIVGSPVAGRNHPDLEDNQIGFYINTLALRDWLQDTDTFQEVLEKVKQTTIAAYEHQLYPFNQLVDELNLARDVSRSPLFDVMVVLQDNEPEAQIVPHLKISGFEIEANISRFDLAFNFGETENKLEIAITYNTDLYKPDSINRLAGHFDTLLHSVLTDAGQPIGDLNILPAWEKQQILVTFNLTMSHYQIPFVPG